MSKAASKYPRHEVRKVKDLKAHPDGVRSAGPDAVFRLGASVRHFNLLRPPVLNIRTGSVLDGDRLLAALRDSGAEEVEVWCVDVPEAEEDAAHLALNNHCGEWQWQAVSLLLKSCVERGVDAGLTGFLDSDTGPLLSADWSPAKVGPMDGTDGSQVEMFK